MRARLVSSRRFIVRNPVQYESAVTTARNARPRASLDVDASSSSVVARVDFRDESGPTTRIVFFLVEIRHVATR